MWNIGKPGGMNGPFYSVLTSSGIVVAMQITEEKYANLIKIAGEMAVEGNFDRTRRAGRKLADIFERDKVGLEYVGLEDYIVRAVVEALFGDL